MAVGPDDRRQRGGLHLDVEDVEVVAAEEREPARLGELVPEIFEAATGSQCFLHRLQRRLIVVPEMIGASGGGASNARPRSGSRAGEIEPLIHATLVGDAVASAPYVVLVADENMNYLAVSDGACELLGYSRADLLQKTVADIVEESDADVRYRRMIGERSQRGRIGLRASDGRVIRAIYEAHETRVAKLPYYVSVLIPIDE